MPSAKIYAALGLYLAIAALASSGAAEIRLRPTTDVDEDAMALKPSMNAIDATSPGDPIRLRPPYATQDGLTIVTEAGRIRIAGVEGPAARAICTDREDKMWACGLQARAALANLIRAQEVTCRRTAPANGEIPSASCSIGAEDIAQSLVADGFARPVGDPGPLAAALEHARAGGLGLWNGGWSIRR